MAGLGESVEEVVDALGTLRESGVEIITIGQSPDFVPGLRADVGAATVVGVGDVLRFTIEYEPPGETGAIVARIREGGSHSLVRAICKQLGVDAPLNPR